MSLAAASFTSASFAVEVERTRLIATSRCKLRVERLVDRPQSSLADLIADFVAFAHGKTVRGIGRPGGRGGI